ncbi:DeoR/GlpR family DNA-binding transcription regulator [Massilia sp. IC2-278]|uniref:DeoR/GlpR family DNA-binding transcription regulator n=1 Tax=Massilia sp. IC2-278 TaxID=2887200 RepID=UPI001E37D615|nr:DeoR/GlpR family DNA-binding transcription regulator [Massilia sp. IC2-278]MCC2961052.1 DeoR/GlpR family DNA-binding transcription regulator [Massilia sp. IC2-278]
MLTSQRKLLLLDLLRQEGKIVAKTVAAQLDISEDTIRRDLRELAAEGLLQRVHGGALPASPAMGDFAARQQIAVDDKSAIGRAAALMIQPGQVVFLDGGTTSAQLVRHLPPDLKATVVTHSPSVAVALVSHPSIEVIMLGGRLFKHSVVGVGAATVEAIRQVRADIYFMGVCSVHPDAGLTTGDFEEAGVKRALSAAAAETIVLASPEKLATASPYQVIELDALSGLVTIASVPDAVLAPYRARGISVHLA